MKKILFAAFAASLLAAGCQKTEVYQPTTTGPEMTFSTEMKKITKADPTPSAGAQGQNDNLYAQGFNIWAYAAYTDDNPTNVNKTTGIYDGMRNWYVDYIEPKNEGEGGEGVGVGSWDPRKEYYWPGQNKYLRFYAVSAFKKSTDNALDYSVNIKANRSDPTAGTSTVNEVTGGDEATDNTGADYELQIENFEVNATAPDEDLMVADFITQNQGDKSVDLTFHHTLAKVEFLFRTATSEKEKAKQPKVYVQQIKVAELYNKGTLNVTPKSTTFNGSTTYTTTLNLSWDKSGATVFSKKVGDVNQDLGVVAIPGTAGSDSKFDWLPTDELPTNERTNNGLLLDPEVLTGENSSISIKGTSFATWLMLPQTLTDKKVEIIYVINDRQFKAVFPLAKDGVDEWTENSYTKYTVSLLPNLISFSATANEWTPTNSIEHQN